MTCKNLIIVTILALIFFNFTSCKKFDTFEQKNTLQETKFFETISATNPIVIKVVDELKRQQGINPKMISTIVHRNGYPLWDKAQIKYRTTNASVIENAEDTIVYIPLAVQGEEKVTAFFIATINNYINLQLYNKFDYEQFGFDTTGLSTANKLAVQFMVLDYMAFGYKDFKLFDDRLLKCSEIDLGTPVKDRKVHIEPVVYQNANLWNVLEFDVCTSTTYLDCTTNHSCCPDGSCSACLDHCWKVKTVCVRVSFLVFVDTGGNGIGGIYSPTSGGGSNNTSSTTVQTCNPTPLISNGLPPCPRGTTLGWEPIVIEEYLPVFDYSNLENPVFVDQDPIEMPPGFSFSFDNFGDSQPQPTRVIGRVPKRDNDEDMISGTDGDISGILSNMPSFTDEELFTEMKDLIHKTSTGVLETVGDEMIAKFRAKTGGEYSNPNLNQKVFDNTKFRDFIVKFGIVLNTKLANANWNIDNVAEISMSLTDRPVFNGVYNKLNGLQILINDTEETIIELNSISINSTTHKWTANLNITIIDHFGLDKNDALTYQNYHAGFAAWWILQRLRDYKPFITKVKFKMDLISE